MASLPGSAGPWDAPSLHLELKVLDARGLGTGLLGLQAGRVCTPGIVQKPSRQTALFKFNEHFDPFTGRERELFLATPFNAPPLPEPAPAVFYLERAGRFQLGPSSSQLRVGKSEAFWEWV